MGKRGRLLPAMVALTLMATATLGTAGAAAAPSGSSAGGPAVSRAVGIAAVGTEGGYVVAGAGGRALTIATRFRGSPRSSGRRLRSPIAGVAGTPGGGYLAVTRGGDVYTFGLRWRGSPRADHVRLSSPVVGIAAAPHGGYDVATAGGDVYAFGTRFHGSPRSRHIRLGSPVVGITVAPDGGYLLATARGNVYSFATAFHGSPVSHHVRLRSPVVGIAATSDGGYFVATADGRVYGHAVGTPRRSFVARVRPAEPLVGITATGDDGYLVVTRRGTVYSPPALLGAPAQDKYPVGTYIESMATNAAGCLGVRVGSDFYAPESASPPCQPQGTPHAWVVLLDPTTLTKQQIVELPTGAAADAALTKALSGYDSHLVVLVAPAGCCGGATLIPNDGFSAIWNSTAGVDDLNHIGDTVPGAKNDGQHLASGPGNPAGDLAGYLQPINAGPHVGTYSFTARDYLSFDTKSAQSTLVATTPGAAQVNGVSALVTGQNTALDVKDGATNWQQPLVGADETDLPSQRWRLAPSGVYGYFHLVDVHSQLCLDIYGGSLAGAAQQYGCDATRPDQADQLWKPVPEADGTYALVSDIDQRAVLTLHDDGTIDASPDTGQAGQRWRFRPMVGAPAPDATGVIETVSGQALDLAGGAQTLGLDGTKAAAAPDLENSTQQWLTIPAETVDGPSTPYPDSYQLVNVDTGKCLASSGQTGSPAERACFVRGDRVDPAQLWKPTPSHGGFALLNESDHLALTKGAASASGRVGQALRRPVAAADRRRRRHRHPRCPSRQQAHARCRGFGDTGVLTTQSEWFTSAEIDVKDGFPATGNHTFSCSDYVPNGETNLFPYLVPDGNSYAYRNISNGVDATVNPFGINTYAGTLNLLWSNYHVSGDYALQIQQECTGDSPRGWSVSSLGSDGVTDLGANVHAELHSFHGKVAVAVDYGTSYATYPDHTADQDVTGDGGTQQLTIPVSGLAPDTTYHYRIVADAKDAGGDATQAFSGADQTFTTSPYGTPVSVQPNTGTANQIWVFRPLQTTETMSVGASHYDLTMPLSWSGFGVLSVDPSGPRAAEAFATNTPDPAVDGHDQQLMGAALAQRATQAGTAVLVQSINQPHPTTGDWNDIATQIDKLGGTPTVFHALDGKGDYALAGCGGCHDAPEVNTAVTMATSHNANDDHLSGLLARSPTTGWRPGLTNPGDPVDYSLLPLALQAPTAWPVPAGVSPSANTAALAWIANKLNMTAPACYAPPGGQPDVRSDYCNLSEDFASDQTNLGQLTYPGANLAPGFSEDDLKAEKLELNTEFSELTKVKDLLTILREPYQDSQTSLEAYITKTANDILTNQLTVTGPVYVDPLGVVSFGLSAFSYFFPENPVLAGALGISSGALALLDSFITDPSDGAPDLDSFKTTAADLGVDLAARLDAASKQFGAIFDLLATDPVKLKTAFDNASDNAAALHDWAYTNDDLDKMQAQLQVGGLQEIWSALMPAAYRLFSVPAPPDGDTVKTNYECVVQRDAITEDWRQSLASEPDSAMFSPIARVSSSGDPQRDTVWAMAAGDGLDAKTLNLPTATLTDRLFQAPSAGGIGLFKPWFYTRSGFATVSPGRCQYNNPPRS